MILYGLYFLLISYLFFAFLVLDSDRLAHEAHEVLETAWTFRLTLVLTIALIVCFGELSRHFYLTFGGFATKQTGYRAWLGFGAEQVADNALFDLLSIYGWHISAIQTSAFWSSTVVFLFNIELELIIIAVIVNQLKRIKLRHFVGGIAAGFKGGMSQEQFSKAMIGIRNALPSLALGGGGFVALIVDIVRATEGHSPAWWIWTITIAVLLIGIGISQTSNTKSSH